MTDHEWQAFVRHRLTDAEARAIAAAKAEGRELQTPIDLTQETVIGIDSGCWTCEQPLTVALLGTECPGEPVP